MRRVFKIESLLDADRTKDAVNQLYKVIMSKSQQSAPDGRNFETKEAVRLLEAFDEIIKSRPELSQYADMPLNLATELQLLLPSFRLVASRLRYLLDTGEYLYTLFFFSFPSAFDNASTWVSADSGQLKEALTLSRNACSHSSLQYASTQRKCDVRSVWKNRLQLECSAVAFSLPVGSTELFQVAWEQVLDLVPTDSRVEIWNTVYSFYYYSLLACLFWVSARHIALKCLLRRRECLCTWLLEGSYWPAQT